MDLTSAVQVGVSIHWTVQEARLHQELIVMNRDQVKKALANLELPEYGGIRDVFGAVLQKRSVAPEPDCAWFDMLAGRVATLEQINSRCLSYVQLVSTDYARKKAEADLLGPAMQLTRTSFQHSLGDFYAELAAITELSKLGYEHFRPKYASPKGKAYEARLDEQPVCIEVKHVRPPQTLVDVFFEEVRRLATSDPGAYPFNFGIEYFYDNTVTPEQEERVLSYLASVRGRTAPFTDTIRFQDDTVLRVKVQPGSCTAMRTWAKRIDDPETFKVEGLLNKVREKAERALAQMSKTDCLKVLVVNINTPWAELDVTHILAAAKIVRDVSDGNLHPYFMHYYHLIPLELTGGSK